MTTNKFAALEAFMSAQGITKSELMDWINGRGKEIIPTELPIVYRQRNELIVEKGLDLNRKSEVWGIQLLSGVTVALCCESATHYQHAAMLAYNLHFKGMPGSLPCLAALVDRMRDPNKTWEINAFNATVKILSQNGIEADNYGGNTWCSMCDRLYYSFDELSEYRQLTCFPLGGYRMAIQF